MSRLDREIREAARKVLRDGNVRQVLGFARGSFPLRARPRFVRREDEVEQLVWNGFCENNLARYLSGTKEKTLLVAKGCDSRALVELIKENQVPRDRVIILGVVCQGMLDRARIEAEMGREPILEAEEHEESLIVRGAGFEKVLDRMDYLYDHCRLCTHPAPLLYDELVGEAPTGQRLDSFSDVDSFGALGREERWNYIAGEVGKCIRCYACRNVCPMCHCPECFVDGSRPQWVGKSTELSDTIVFHLVRAFHLAGRCVACGACEKACPMGVDIGKLNRKLQSDVANLFHYEAGCSLEEVTPLATFRIDDPQPGLVEP